MPAAFLKTTIQQRIPLSSSTIEAANLLSELGATIEHTDTDFTPFAIHGEDYEIVGVIERWAGTEARIRFEGNVTLEAFDSALRNRISVVAVIVIVVLSLSYGTSLSIQVFGTAGVFAIMNTHLFFAVLVAIIISVPTVFLINRDPNAQRRWNAQQRMGKKVSEITVLANRT